MPVFILRTLHVNVCAEVFVCAVEATASKLWKTTSLVCSGMGLFVVRAELQEGKHTNFQNSDTLSRVTLFKVIVGVCLSTSNFTIYLCNDYKAIDQICLEVKLLAKEQQLCLFTKDSISFLGNGLT